jgi:hypothetical protein
MTRTYFNKRRQITFLVLTLALFLGFRGSAYAITLSPVRIEVTGNPGESITKEIILTNESDGLITYYSSFANFEASGESGNPSFVNAKEDLGTWMTTDSSVTLKPKESKTLNFHINIPKNAEPGGHFAAIFWSTTPDTEGAGLSIGARAGILILLSVNGDVKEEGGLLDFSMKDKKIFYTTLPVSFSYRFKNDGGDRIKPVGKIKMHDLIYIPEDTIDANPGGGNILPKSTRKFNVDWVKKPRSKDYIAPTGLIANFFDQALYEWHNYAFGPYFAKLNVLYGTNATRATETVFFFVLPWQLLICLAVIFIIVFWGGKKLIRRYNRHIIQKARLGMNTPNGANHV